jgi:cysteine desulfurase
MSTLTRLYADHNATSALRDTAREAMVRALALAGNPSSVHAEGRAARAVLEDARERLASALEVRSEDVTFTSGATEALHLALDSAKAAGFAPVFVGAGEHDAVWAYAGLRWPDLQTVPLDRAGRIDPDWLAAAIHALPAGVHPLVVMQGANNETGALQPLAQVTALVRVRGGALVCDAVQLAGKEEVARYIGFADWLVISSHKIGGPTGAGALVTLPGTPLTNIRPGGGQERGARAGTQNVPAIAGFAAAAAEALGDAAVADFKARTSAERDQFEDSLAEALPDLVFIARDAPRLSNTACVALPGWEAARQIMALDLAGAAVSAGAACSSGKVKASRVLLAAGWPAEVAGSAIRASFGWSTRAGDGERLAALHLAAAQRANLRLPEKV